MSGRSPKGIEDWEAKRAILRDEFSEELSDRMAPAIITSILPAEFQDIVFTTTGSGEVTYEEVRDKVLSIAGSRIQQASPTPMDIGIVNGDKAEVCPPCGDELWNGPGYGEAAAGSEEEFNLLGKKR